ncbi:hypothetical protein NW754_003204 [Fusarium falciforme]|nr:hypothetical protein NW754_003204 [Fusarium falciforme]
MSTKKKLSSPIFYTVAWISALPIERAAATAMLDEHHDEPDAFERNGNDSNAYDWGAIGQHNIVIASLQAGIYGTASAATTASQLLSSLPHIRIGLMVGIGGGIPQSDRDIRLGDIVIGQPDGSTGGVVQRGALNMPPPVLLNALSKLQANHEMDEPMIMGLLDGMIKKKPRMKQQYKHQGIKNDRLFSPDYDHVGGNTCDGCDSSGEVKRPERDSIDPEIHYGIIASGNTLVKDAATRDSLVQRVGEECLCFEMEAAGLANTFPCLVIRGISDYADSHKNFQWQRYASATAAAFAVELLGYVPVRQLEETPRALELTKKITNLNESFQAFVSKTVLSRLPAARGAAYDSSDDWLEATCMKNTRVSILNEIHEWANDPTSTTLFWLNGMAGTGKSTISRTVAQRLAAAGNLGGSFFFKKGEADRSNPSKLFTTLAAGLLRWQPAVSRYIERAIDENPQIFDQIYEDQFEKLIFEPLSEATPPPERPIVMVVDALDECQNVVITRIITDILPRAASLQHIRLKFFLTSRPEMAVQAGFSKVQPKSTYRDFLLHNVSHDVIKKDLEIFLTATIAHIRDRFNSLRHGSSMIPPNWPSQDVIDRLVDMAIPLFIVAATVCRFVDDQRLGNPKRQIKQVLALRDREHESMLDQMYLTVLNQQFGDDYSLRKKHQIIEEFRRIVGSVILLSSPLTIPALARLLRKDGDDDDLQSTIEDRLEILHSVLSVPQPEERPCVPVRVLHSSFRDFLVDPQHRASNSFWVDEAKTHMALWESCLGVMKAALRQDMCGLGLPATSQASIEREAVDDCLPPELQYACLYWIDHIEQAGVDSATGLSILTFFKENLFHWLEALSLMGRSYESVDMIERLKDISTNASCSQLSDFLDDTTRFIGHNSHTIATTPLQIYSSAVVFAPMKSIVRETFKAHVPDWILIQPSGEDRWNPFLQGLETWGETFVFSPNSKFIALQAGNMVQIWRVNTGKCLQVLECSGSSLASPLAFSADSNMLVTPFENWIQVWRVDTGQCIQQFEHLESEDLDGTGNRLA